MSKNFNLIKFNIIIIRYGTSNNYYTEQDAFLLVMLRPVGKAGRARHHYSSYNNKNYIITINAFLLCLSYSGSVAQHIYMFCFDCLAY
jgi:hypothetical protein